MLYAIIVHTYVKYMYIHVYWTCASMVAVVTLTGRVLPLPNQICYDDNDQDDNSHTNKSTYHSSCNSPCCYTTNSGTCCWWSCCLRWWWLSWCLRWRGWCWRWGSCSCRRVANTLNIPQTNQIMQLFFKALKVHACLIHKSAFESAVQPAYMYIQALFEFLITC